MKISQNIIKSPLKFWFISHISVHSMHLGVLGFLVIAVINGFIMYILLI